MLVFLDYDMIKEHNAEKYCCEDISLIENYSAAVADKTQTWDCHHRAEILPCGRYTKAQLDRHGLYWNVPAAQLIFLTHSEHMRMHNEGKKLSDEYRANLRAAMNRPETRAKMSAAKKGKHHSAETRAKLSTALKGRHFSPETRAKMSEAAKRRHKR